MKLDPLTIIVVVASLGVGGLAGKALDDIFEKKVDTVELMTQVQIANSEMVDSITASMQTQAESDANVADKLSDEPAACWLMRHAESREEREDLGLSCALATCWQMGLQAQQRPECQALQAAYIEKQACDESAP